MLQGINVVTIELVIQWRVTCDLNTLWQRFGRAVWDLTRNGVAILFVEGKYIDEEKEKAVARAEKAKEARKRKAARAPASPHRAKVARLANTTNIVDSGGAGHVSESEDEGQVEASMPSRGRENIARNAMRSVPNHNLDELRAEFKAERKPKASFQKKRSAEDIVSAEMDALINAATRPQYRCYRIPIMAFYANDKTGMFGPCLQI